MHSPDGEGTRGPEERTDRTAQGTLDMFLAEEPKGPRAAPVKKAAPTSPHETVASAATAAAEAPHGEQRSIDAFELAGQGARQELEARAPRAAAGLMLEHDIERVARREAATGITRDELVIVIAREVQLPLEDLHLVDSYVSDLLLEGKLTLVGERVVLASEPVAGTKGPVGPAKPGRPARQARPARPARKARSGKAPRRGKPGASRSTKPRKGRARAAGTVVRPRRRRKGGGGK